MRQQVFSVPKLFLFLCPKYKRGTFSTDKMINMAMCKNKCKKSLLRASIAFFLDKLSMNRLSMLSFPVITKWKSRFNNVFFRCCELLFQISSSVKTKVTFSFNK